MSKPVGSITIPANMHLDELKEVLNLAATQTEQLHGTQDKRKRISMESQKKVQTQEDVDTVTKMVIDLLEQKGFTFSNFTEVIEQVKSFYENNAII